MLAGSLGSKVLGGAIRVTQGGLHSTVAQIGYSIDLLIFCAWKRLAFASVLERRSLGAGKAPGPESPAEAACCLYICHSAVHLHSASQCCLHHTVQLQPACGD